MCKFDILCRCNDRLLILQKSRDTHSIKIENKKTECFIETLFFNKI